jgi:hypothetical protein
MSNNVKSQNLWRRGDKLLTLSRQAREQGHTEIADDILDRAVQLLEEARVLEQRPEPGVVSPAPSPDKSGLSAIRDQSDEMAFLTRDSWR